MQHPYQLNEHFNTVCLVLYEELPLYKACAEASCLCLYSRQARCVIYGLVLTCSADLSSCIIIQPAAARRRGL